MLSPSLNNVVIKSREGKIENSRDSLIFIVISRIINDNDILSIKNISITNGFKGMNIKRTITITNNEMALLNKFFIPDSPF